MWCYYPHFVNENLRLKGLRGFPRVIGNGRAGVQTPGISDFRYQRNPISLTAGMTNVQSTKFTVKTLKRQVNAVLSIFCRSGIQKE